MRKAELQTVSFYKGINKNQDNLVDLSEKNSKRNCNAFLRNLFLKAAIQSAIVCPPQINFEKSNEVFK